MFNCNECSFLWACNQNKGYCPKHMISDIISEMDEREQFVVKMHCGLEDGIQHSFAELGRQLDLTGTRISQIFKDAIRTHKDISLLRTPRTIVQYGANNENYALFYNSKYSDYFDFSQTIIHDKAVPNIILNKISNKYRSQLNTSICDLMLSDRLIATLLSKNINTIIGILSLPFDRIFFDVLGFDDTLFRELEGSLVSFLNVKESAVWEYPISWQTKDIDCKMILKEYIHKYIFEHNSFFERDEDIEQSLLLKARKHRLAKVISECFYLGLINQLNTTDFNFASYWHQSCQLGFSGDKLFEFINKSSFPDAIKNIITESDSQNVKELDFQVCRLSLPSWHHLQRVGIGTIGDIIYTADENLYRFATPKIRQEIKKTKDMICRIANI